MTIDLDAPELKGLLGTSAILRAQGRFSEAIAVVEASVAEMDDAALVPAYTAIIWAAEEAGFRDKAIEYATRLKALDPSHPAVSRILDS